MKAASDLKLVKRVLKGDQDACTELYNTHKQGVTKLCIQLMKTTDVDDLVQETFAIAFKRLETYKGEAKFSTWLHRVGTNCVFMQMRKMKNKPPLLSIATDQNDEDRFTVISIPDKRPTQDIILFANEVCEAIGSLPKKAQKVVLLRIIYDMPIKETAKKLGLTNGTVKSQLHKGIYRLRTRFKGAAK